MKKMGYTSENLNKNIGPHTRKREVVLISLWTPIITTAKEGIRKLISCGSISKENSSVKVLSQSGEPLFWEEWVDEERASGQEATIYIFIKQTIPVPNYIIIDYRKWVYQNKRKKPNLRYLYKRYKGRQNL